MSGRIADLNTHVGWCEVDGERCFLTNGGAIGKEGIEVSLRHPLAQYRLPSHSELAANDVKESIEASLRFLDIGNFDVMAPLWASMYLSPLCEILRPALTLWILGPTGSFKSTLSALALCHFGDFDYSNMPAHWSDTGNFLKWSMSRLKGIPLIIDSWYIWDKWVGPRMKGKVNGIIRSQEDWRGLVISTGTQMPGGGLAYSRLFVVGFKQHRVDIPRLNKAQAEQHMYKYAMAQYILWLRDNWYDIRGYLCSKWLEWRNKAAKQSAHLQLPSAVACLYAGFDLGMTFALKQGVIEQSRAQYLSDQAWDCFVYLASQQLQLKEESCQAE